LLQAPPASQITIFGVAVLEQDGYRLIIPVCGR
jgi:hypothetical protein